MLTNIRSGLVQWHDKYPRFQLSSNIDTKQEFHSLGPKTLHRCYADIPTVHYKVPGEHQLDTV